MGSERLSGGIHPGNPGVDCVFFATGGLWGYFFFRFGIFAPLLRASLRAAAMACLRGWPDASISLMFSPIVALDEPFLSGIFDLLA